MSIKFAQVTASVLLAFGLIASGCTRELVNDSKTPPSMAKAPEGQTTVVVPPSGSPSVVIPQSGSQSAVIVPPSGNPPATVVVPNDGSPAIVVPPASGMASAAVIPPPKPKVIHCSGKEWADDSSLSVLPIPVVAFFFPQADLNEIKAEDYLSRCGENQQLINRKVELEKGACIPAALTRFITLGIWQWCPTKVEWEADRISAG